MDAVKISNWFKSGKNYKEGLQLFTEYSSNTFLAKILSHTDSSFNRKKLEEELRKMLNAAPKSFNVPTVEEFIALPEQIQRMKTEANRLFKEGTNLHARLEQMPEDERAKAAFRIKEIFKNLDHIWYCLDFYFQHKRMPDNTYQVKEKSIEEMSELELYKYMLTLRTYVSKQKMEYKPILEKVEARYKSLTHAERIKKTNG